MTIIEYILCPILLYIGYKDTKTGEISDISVLAVFVLSLIDFFKQGKPFIESILGFFSLSLILFITTYLLRNKYPDGAFGGGDIKLTASIGFLLGYKLTFMMVVLLAGLMALRSIMYSLYSSVRLGMYFAIATIIVLAFKERFIILAKILNI